MKARPIAVPVALNKFAQAARVVLHVTPDHYPFALLDSPRAPHDARLHLRAWNDSLAVDLDIPLASQPPPAWSVKGGVFDTSALKDLDGFESALGPVHVERQKSSLRLSGGLLPMKGITIREEQADQPRILLPDLEGADVPIEREFTLSEARRYFTRQVEETTSLAYQGAVAVLFVLDIVRPAAVTLAWAKPGHLRVAGAWDGLGFTAVIHAEGAL